MSDFDVIVVGGGHAGIEASLVSGRRGFKTLLLTLNTDRIGQLSCNPSMGGGAKSHLVFEVDCLGGEIGYNADRTGIQFKMLNRSRGPAIWALRAQIDRDQYREKIKKIVMDEVTVLEEEVTDILTESGRVCGVRTDSGRDFTGNAVILTTGTFLRGLIHIGLESTPSGRMGEKPANRLSRSLENLGFELGRLKTGTSARVDEKTIDFKKMEIQPGDDNPENFSYRTENFDPPDIPCYLTWTNPKTHEIIENNLNQSPLVRGKITGVEPRYCPSLETKIIKFPEKERHHVFIEPDGIETPVVYLNGVSSSLPEDIQLKFLRTINGLENVEIIRPGYAVEYDFVKPTQLKHSLETRKIEGLFHAGQINGTSGYEEAAAQGIMAGINATLKLEGKEPIVFERDEAYTGVLIDDLTVQGTEEPYRMFTSRAEYRLLLRQDNADLRMTEYAYKLGLVNEERYKEIQKKRRMIEDTEKKLRKTTIKPDDIEGLNEAVNAFELAKREDYDFADIEEVLGLNLPANVRKGAAINIRYDGYIQRARRKIRELKRMEGSKIPEDIDYSTIESISTEARQKLDSIRPETLGQASRISGVKPTDLQAIMAWLKKKDMVKG